MDFINMFSLKGKNALVTGASYGICLLYTSDAADE